MALDSDEMKRREVVARAAIRRLVGADDEVDSFISHNLREVKSEYWLDHTGTETPTPRQVFELLVLRDDWDLWEEEDRGKYFDFTLPGDVTQYVICVQFDDNGDVLDVVVES